MRPLTPLNIPPKTGVVVEVLVPEALVEDERGGFCAFLAPLPCVFVSSRPCLPDAAGKCQMAEDVMTLYDMNFADPACLFDGNTQAIPVRSEQALRESACRLGQPERAAATAYAHSPFDGNTQAIVHVCRNPRCRARDHRAFFFLLSELCRGNALPLLCRGNALPLLITMVFRASGTFWRIACRSQASTTFPDYYICCRSWGGASSASSPLLPVPVVRCLSSMMEAMTDEV